MRVISSSGLVESHYGPAQETNPQNAAPTAAHREIARSRSAFLRALRLFISTRNGLSGRFDFDLGFDRNNVASG
jgi:hypothetical protein